MAKAIAKYIRMSPRKIRRVVNVIRGKSTKEATAYLKLMPYSACKVVEKVLNSAISNAKNNESLNSDELKISKAYVDQSTTLRRWRAMSRGRGYPILKRTSHVTIEVVPDLSRSVEKRTIKKAQNVPKEKLEQKQLTSDVSAEKEDKTKVVAKKKEVVKKEDKKNKTKRKDDKK